MLQKNQDRLEELRNTGRANEIYKWHQEILRKMKLNLIELRGVKIYVQ